MSFEFLVALVALIVAVVALVMVFELRSRLQRNDTEWTNRRQLDADVQASHAYMHTQLDEMRRDIDAAHRQIAELKAATEVVPAPPLPKARSGGLDDLREQLRAAHREPDDTDEA